MKMRFLPTTVLAATLLFSQGGTFLVAALCPHLQSGTAACEVPPAETTLSHEDMGHVSMDHPSEYNPDPNTVAVGHGNGRAEALYDLWTTLRHQQAPALYLELVSRRYRVLTGREIETVR